MNKVMKLVTSHSSGYKTSPDKVQMLVQLDKVQLYIYRKEGVKEYCEIL